MIVPNHHFEELSIIIMMMTIIIKRITNPRELEISEVKIHTTSSVALINKGRILKGVKLT